MQETLNLTRVSAAVTRDQREAALGQKAVTYWITGLSGAGKSTLACALEQQLFLQGRHCYVLDGDNVRYGLNKNLGFSAQDRAENIRRIAEVSQLMNDAGLIVICAFISPFNADREIARAIIGPERYVEIYLNTPLRVCEARDPKGLYQEARAGKIAQFTGISSPYEAPLEPDLTIDTSQTQLPQAIDMILHYRRAGGAPST